MSCVLIYNNISEKKIHIVSDKLCSDDISKIYIKNEKFFQKEKFIFCITGSVKMMNVINHELNINFENKTDETIIFVELPYRIQQLCEKYKIDNGWEMIVIFNNKIYIFQYDCSVIEASDEQTVFGMGVGGDVAVGYFVGVVGGLKLGDKNIDCEKIMVEAVETSAYVVPGVSCDTEYKEFSYV